MRLNEIIEKKGITKYRLAKESGVPHATLNDLCSGKTRIEKCSAETLYKLAQALNVPMEAFMEESAEKRAEEERIRAYEYGLPGYLQHDLDAYKEGLKNGQVLYPVRIALSGKETTPGGATELAVVLGKEETLNRIKQALAKLA